MSLQAHWISAKKQPHQSLSSLSARTIKRLPRFQGKSETLLTQVSPTASGRRGYTVASFPFSWERHRGLGRNGMSENPVVRSRREQGGVHNLMARGWASHRGIPEGQSPVTGTHDQCLCSQWGGRAHSACCRTKGRNTSTAEGDSGDSCVSSFQLGSVYTWK